MVRELAIVQSIEEISSYFMKVVFHSPEIAFYAKPGQFVNILPDTHWGRTMRRPMSIAGAVKDEFSIIFKVVGEGTRLMSRWSVGDTVDIIGPLGNTWPNPVDEYPVLLGGGVGIAPVWFFHNWLKSRYVDHTLIMGARKADEHFLQHDPEKQLLLTTDDGSAGISGNVITAFRRLIQTPGPVRNYVLYACGPSPMLNAVKEFAAEHDLNCFVALETVMACGFGNCQGCAVEKTGSQESHSYRQKYALVCLDGPVFNAKEILSC